MILAQTKSAVEQKSQVSSELHERLATVDKLKKRFNKLHFRSYSRLYSRPNFRPYSRLYSVSYSIPYVNLILYLS